jgi:hypothetical protein
MRWRKKIGEETSGGAEALRIDQRPGRNSVSCKVGQSTISASMVSVMRLRHAGSRGISAVIACEVEGEAETVHAADEFRNNEPDRLDFAGKSHPARLHSVAAFFSSDSVSDCAFCINPRSSGR